MLLELTNTSSSAKRSFSFPELRSFYSALTKGITALGARMECSVLGQMLGVDLGCVALRANAQLNCAS